MFVASGTPNLLIGVGYQFFSVRRVGRLLNFVAHPAGLRRVGSASGSSRHQDGQIRLAKNRPCDTAEHPLAYVGVAICTHNQEIGAESGGPRKQEAAYLLAVGRYAVYPHVRAMVSQVTRD